jgi:hypothetical protein
LICEHNFLFHLVEFLPENAKRKRYRPDVGLSLLLDNIFGGLGCDAVNNGSMNSVCVIKKSSQESQLRPNIEVNKRHLNSLDSAEDPHEYFKFYTPADASRSRDTVSFILSHFILTVVVFDGHALPKRIYCQNEVLSDADTIMHAMHHSACVSKLCPWHCSVGNAKINAKLLCFENTYEIKGNQTVDEVILIMIITFFLDKKQQGRSTDSFEVTVAYIHNAIEVIKAHNFPFTETKIIPYNGATESIGQLQKWENSAIANSATVQRICKLYFGDLRTRYLHLSLVVAKARRFLQNKERDFDWTNSDILNDANSMVTFTTTLH